MGHEPHRRRWRDLSAAFEVDKQTAGLILSTYELSAKKRTFDEKPTLTKTKSKSQSL